MKIARNILPLLIALLPQILFGNYSLVLVSTVAVGFISGWFMDDKKVFLKIALCQFIFYSILFLTTNGSVFYLYNVVENLGLPSFSVPLLFILFNTLNISILFSFGFRLQKLMFNMHSSPKTEEPNAHA